MGKTGKRLVLIFNPKKSYKREEVKDFFYRAIELANHFEISGFSIHITGGGKDGKTAIHKFDFYFE